MGRRGKAIGSNAPISKHGITMNVVTAVRMGDLMSGTSISKAVFIATVFLIGGSLLLAQHGGHGGPGGNQSEQISRPSNPHGTEGSGTIKGRLVSQSEDSITIEAFQGGESARFTYGVDDRTEFRGAIRVGSQVSVTYVEQGRIRSATRVEGQRKRRGC